jgi:hypothetical protein
MEQFGVSEQPANALGITTLKLPVAFREEKKI